MINKKSNKMIAKKMNALKKASMKILQLFDNIWILNRIFSSGTKFMYYEQGFFCILLRRGHTHNFFFIIRPLFTFIYLYTYPYSILHPHK